MSRLKYLLAVTLLAAASNVWAGIPVSELLSTDPAEPRANQQFDLVYTLEFCGDTFAPDFPQNRIVDVSGGVIRVTARYALNICFPDQYYPPTYRWSIGPLAAGTYQTELYGYTEQGGPENSFPIASGAVTILPAILAPKPNVIPATGKLGLLCLSLLTVLAAIWGMRRQ